MFNFKLSGITAGAAFIFSLVIGLASGVRVPVLFLRAFIFAIVFFGLSCLIYWLISQFVPEAFSESEDTLDFNVPGSRVDITVDDSPIIGAFPANNSESLDDIGGKPSTQPQTPAVPLDQKEKELYNENEGVPGDFDLGGGSFNDLTGESSAESQGSLEKLQEAEPEAALDMGGTASLDGTTETLSDNDLPANGETAGFSGDEPRRPKSTRKPPEMAGDFNPKELAQAIQTVLKRDEKG